MTLFDVQRLFEHWRRFPPVRVLVAGFIGFTPKDAKADKSNHLSADEAMALMRATGGKIPGLGSR